MKYFFNTEIGVVTRVSFGWPFVHYVYCGKKYEIRLVNAEGEYVEGDRVFFRWYKKHLYKGRIVEKENSLTGIAISK